MATMAETAAVFAWLEALKPGDEVAASCGGFRQSPAILHVVRVTRCHILASHRPGGGEDARFDKSSGRRIGPGSSYRRIDPVTPAFRAKVEYAALAFWLGAFGSPRATLPSLAVLRAMRAAYDTATAAEVPA